MNANKGAKPMLAHIQSLATHFYPFSKGAIIMADDDFKDSGFFKGKEFLIINEKGQVIPLTGNIKPKILSTRNIEPTKIPYGSTAVASATNYPPNGLLSDIWNVVSDKQNVTIVIGNNNVIYGNKDIKLSFDHLSHTINNSEIPQELQATLLSLVNELKTSKNQNNMAKFHEVLGKILSLSSSCLTLYNQIKQLVPGLLT